MITLCVTVYNSAKEPINATVFSNTYSGRMLHVTTLVTNHLISEWRTDQFWDALTHIPKLE